MANVVFPHPQIDFHRGPVSHSPSPFGFGFGPSSSSTMNSWPTTATHNPFSHSAAFQQLASTMSQPTSRPNKRRAEDDDDQDVGRGTKDDAMDRSPTPERPKRVVPKRARTAAAVLVPDKSGGPSKENKADAGDQDVDVGVLLASLPSESLLPLLTSLLQAQPSLKPVVLSLLPRPSLDTAIQTLAQSAKKLRDAYPYSTHSAFSNASSSLSPSPPSNPFGFGFASGFNSRPIGFGSPSPLGFGRPSPPSPSGSDSNGGMRDEYVVSRLRPHINDYVSASISYLPYFSFSVSSAPVPSSTPLQAQNTDKSHPTETFTFLQTLLSQMLSQPALTQASLVPLLLPRLLAELGAWLDRVDEVVNKEGGMFREDTVRGWERMLDEFAEAKGHGLEALRDIRDRWVAKVGWMVGRTLQPMMEN